MSTGVVRIDAEDCDSGYAGSGFLIGDNLVATVAHVIEDDGIIAVTSPTEHITTAATVIGISHDHDVALLRTSSPLPGHRFSFASGYPEQSSDLMAIGFPLGGAMQPTKGTVTALHQHVVVDGDGQPDYHLSDAVITDAVLNPGNSGGPWLSPDGRVIALTEGGPGFSPDEPPVQGDNDGVSSVVATKDIDGWIASPQQVPPGQCAASSTSEGAELATLGRYFDDINSSDYDSAYAQLASANKGGYPGFLDGVLSSEDSATDGSGASFDVGQSGLGTDGLPYIDVTFRSRQDADHAPAGTRDTCDLWALRYKFVVQNGVPVIRGAPAQPGKKPYRSC